MKVTKVYGELAKQKKRVAAYCRVSTDTEGQQESYDTQVRYYEALIPENDNWEFAGVYADEGRTGTNAKHRPEFMRLMEDAFQGEIDIILTKSISRFARNVVDCQRYVKDLKCIGVEVCFEREGISSMDASADFIFSMLATVAQEESRSISENVRWRYSKDFEKGIYRVGNNRIQGYDMNEEGRLIPNDDAWIVKTVFEQFVSGRKLTEIARGLNEAGATRLRSRNPFTADRVRKMLQNEYYVGDMLLQKSPPQHFLTKRPDPTAEFKSYYVGNSHEGIIDRETWEKTKEIFDAIEESRKMGIVKNCTETHFLYGKIFCDHCGAPYKRRTLRTVGGEKYIAWNCKERQKGKEGNGCKNRTVSEEKILFAITENLGITEFDRAAFEAQIARVLIEPDGIAINQIG